MGRALRCTRNEFNCRRAAGIATGRYTPRRLRLEREQRIARPPEAWFVPVAEQITEMRNSIAHVTPHLNLPHSFSQIERCADIINALFSNQSGKDKPEKG
jgi:hypothetical protein